MKTTLPEGMNSCMNHAKQRVLGVIPARFGSTRFPGKPLALILGKTLLQRTYENALRCPLFESLIVATDDARIFQHVQEFGGNVVMTSSFCATGTDRLIEVINNDSRFTGIEIIVNVQGDEPCIDPKVIQQVIDILQKDSQAVMSTAVVKIDSAEEACSSSVVKCVFDSQKNAIYFSRALIPSGHSSQFSPEMTYYKHIGIYGYRRDFLLRYGDLPNTPLQMAENLEQLKVLEHGFRIKVAVIQRPVIEDGISEDLKELLNHVSIGVDTPEDIQKVERLLCKQNTYL